MVEVCVLVGDQEVKEGSGLGVVSWRWLEWVMGSRITK